MRYYCRRTLVGWSDLSKLNLVIYHGAILFFFCCFAFFVFSTDNPFSFVEYKVLSVLNPMALYFQREVTSL